MFFPWPPSTNIGIGRLYWLYCKFTTRPGASRQQSVPSLCYWEEEMVPGSFTGRDLLYSVVFISPHLFLLAWQNKPARNLCILSHFLIPLPLFLKFYYVAFLQSHWYFLREVFYHVLQGSFAVTITTSFYIELNLFWGLFSLFYSFWSLFLNGHCGSFITVFLKITVCADLCQIYRTKISLHSFLLSLPCPFVEAEFAAPLIVFLLDAQVPELPLLT